MNAIGNAGGFAGPFVAGWLEQQYHSVAIPFNTPGLARLVAAGLAFLLPKAAAQVHPPASKA